MRQPEEVLQRRVAVFHAQDPRCTARKLAFIKKRGHIAQSCSGSDLHTQRLRYAQIKP